MNRVECSGQRAHRNQRKQLKMTPDLSSKNEAFEVTVLFREPFDAFKC